VEANDVRTASDLVSSWWKMHHGDLKKETDAQPKPRVIAAYDECGSGFTNCLNIILNAAAFAVILDRPLHVRMPRDSLVSLPPTVTSAASPSKKPACVLDLHPMTALQPGARHIACSDLCTRAAADLIVSKDAWEWSAYLTRTNGRLPSPS